MTSRTWTTASRLTATRTTTLKATTHPPPYPLPSIESSKQSKRISIRYVNIHAWVNMIACEDFWCTVQRRYSSATILRVKLNVQRWTTRSGLESTCVDGASMIVSVTLCCCCCCGCGCCWWWCMIMMDDCILVSSNDCRSSTRSKDYHSILCWKRTEHNLRDVAIHGKYIDTNRRMYVRVWCLIWTRSELLDTAKHTHRWTLVSHSVARDLDDDSLSLSIA